MSEQPPPPNEQSSGCTNDANTICTFENDPRLDKCYGCEDPKTGMAYFVRSIDVSTDIQDRLNKKKFKDFSIKYIMEHAKCISSPKKPVVEIAPGNDIQDSVLRFLSGDYKSELA
ncbi:hypothetical protein BGZ49_002106 [Haplosporangium sp. Z 27]|nr:hypothetical protein BGZ49_002106 [Haplosporangium sp. Z 27]